MNCHLGFRGSRPAGHHNQSLPGASGMAQYKWAPLCGLENLNRCWRVLPGWEASDEWQNRENALGLRVLCPIIFFSRFLKGHVSEGGEVAYAVPEKNRLLCVVLSLAMNGSWNVSKGEPFCPSVALLVSSEQQTTSSHLTWGARCVSCVSVQERDHRLPTNEINVWLVLTTAH